MQGYWIYTLVAVGLDRQDPGTIFHPGFRDIEYGSLYGGCDENPGWSSIAPACEI